MTQIKTTFYIVHFTKADKYVGVAHSYDNGILLSTPPQTSYTDARQHLGEVAEKNNCELRYFDGEYTCVGDGHYMFSV